MKSLNILNGESPLISVGLPVDLTGNDLIFDTQIIHKNKSVIRVILCIVQ